MNRLANIFWHYYGGALIGCRQRLWPPEHQYLGFAKWSALCLYLLQLIALVALPLPQLVRLGLALLVFSPQWTYIFIKMDHPVFEFRGYSMAAGVSLLATYMLQGRPVLALCLFSVWASLSLVRRRILTQPLAFWERAQKENHNG